MDRKSVDEEFHHGVRTLARTLSIEGNILPELPDFILERINFFCPRYSKITVMVDESTSGTIRERYENFYACRDFFIKNIIYGLRWNEDVTTHNEKGGLRSRFVFISTSQTEHDNVWYYLHRDAIYNVYTNAYHLHF